MMLSSWRYGVIRFFRSYMAPLDPVSATKWYTRMRRIYLFGAFQIAGITIYLIRKDKLEQERYKVDEPYVDKIIRAMDLKDVTVINYSLKGKQSQYQTDADELKQKFEEKKARVYEKYSI